MDTPSLGLIGLFALFVACTVILSRKRKARLPPGPPGLPVVGNVFDLPKAREWLAYQRWGRQYGTDVIHVKLLGTHVVVLNSLDAAKTLMEKRSRLYSDRAYSVMLHELTGWERNIAFMPYGDVWRAHRRSFNQYFHERAVDKYQPQVQVRVQTLMHLLLEDPTDFIKHIRFSAGALLLEVAYGIHIKDKDSPYILAAEIAVEATNQIGNTRAFLVDSLPILRYVPSWFPGAGFKRQAAEWKKAVLDTYNVPWNKTKEALSAGKLRTSIASLLFARAEGQLTRVQEDVIQNVLGVAFAAGEDTTTSTLSTFFLLMTLHPDAQAAAQEELDNVCGHERLPSFEDKDAVPFVTAVMYETMRWHPALPLGVAHRLTTDDEYEGYLLPGGSIILHNSWAILHDEKMYPEPERFNPWRFLDSEGQLRKDVVAPESIFGFGRRICPGRHFALQVLWLSIARILAAFKIEKPVDGEGKTIEPSGEFSSGLLCYPLPFKTNIKPRSPRAAELARSGVSEDSAVGLDD